MCFTKYMCALRGKKWNSGRKSFVSIVYVEENKIKRGPRKKISHAIPHQCKRKKELWGYIRETTCLFFQSNSLLGIQDPTLAMSSKSKVLWTSALIPSQWAFYFCLSYSIHAKLLNVAQFDETWLTVFQILLILENADKEKTRKIVGLTPETIHILFFQSN